jgi:two-component system, chemotaxis family, protein-glutamate methylesterase/glutaminase
MVRRDLIVIGASAGGVEALTTLFKLLPEDLAASALVVIHISPGATGRLPQIIRRVSNLQIKYAESGEMPENGKIFVAPPNNHLYVQDSKLLLSNAPRVNGVRPAIDVLFRSAAEAYGSRVIGIILSGMLSDGAEGLMAIKAAGGIAIVQDPDEAAFAGMPNRAIQKVPVDHILPIHEIASQVIEYTEKSMQTEISSGGMAMAPGKNSDYEILKADREGFELAEGNELRTLIACPDCGGVLWELDINGIRHYRCHIGHGFSEESLVHLQADYLETALWTAVRVLDERSMLAKRLASRAAQKKAARSEEQFQSMAREADRARRVIEELILHGSLLDSNALSIDEIEDVK